MGYNKADRKEGTLHVRINKVIKRRLKKEAKRRGLSMSELVSILIDESCAA